MEPADVIMYIVIFVVPGGMFRTLYREVCAEPTMTGPKLSSAVNVMGGGMTDSVCDGLVVTVDVLPGG